MKNKILEENPEFTKVSSKGQLVIPKGIRDNLHIKEGDIFATTVAYDLIILKKMKDKLLEEDLMILKEVKEAWHEIETGKAKTMEAEDFLKEIEEW